MTNKAKNIVSELTDIAKLLKDNTKNNNSNSTISTNNTDTNNSLDSSNNKENSTDNNNTKDTNSNNNQSSNESNKSNSNNENKSTTKSQENGRKELEDAINDLNDLLNKKGSQQNGESGNSNSQQGSQQTQQGSNKTSSNGSVKTIVFRGQKLDLNNAPQDIKIDTSSDRDDTFQDTQLKGFLSDAIAAAKQMIKGGSEPGMMVREFENSIKPVVPRWSNILNACLRTGYRTEPTYLNSFRNNRITMLNRGSVILPGTKRIENLLPNLCIALDSSGSIDKEDMKKYLTDISGFLQDKQKIVKGYFCWWDTRTYDEAQGEFTNVDDIMKKKPVGGGGTNANAAFDYAYKHKCKYIMIFTDGGLYSQPNLTWQSKFSRVIWVLNNEQNYDDFQPAFGRKCI